MHEKGLDWMPSRKMVFFKNMKPKKVVLCSICCKNEKINVTFREDAFSRKKEKFKYF